MDQLDKTDPPAYPKSYPIWLAIQSIIQVIRGIHQYLVPFIDSGEELSEIPLIKEMVLMVAPMFVQTVALLILSNIDDKIHEQETYQAFLDSLPA